MRTHGQNRLSNDLEKAAAAAAAANRNGAGPGDAAGPAGTSANGEPASARRGGRAQLLVLAGVALACIGLASAAQRGRAGLDSHRGVGVTVNAAPGRSLHTELAVTPARGDDDYAHVRALWASHTGDYGTALSEGSPAFWGAAQRLLQTCPAGCSCSCATATPTASTGPTPTRTNTNTVAPTPTNTQAATPTPSNTQAATPTPSNTQAATPTITAVATATAGPVKLVTACTQPGKIAITFDDGPFDYTAGLLTAFAGKTSGGVPAHFTVFQNGDNWSCIYRYADVIRQMDAAGHQLASHTWSHPDLTTLSTADITTQMRKMDYAFQKLIGKAPLYMRPPYGNYNNAVLNTLTSLGYRVATMWNVDSADWQTPADMTGPKAMYNAVPKGSTQEQTTLSLQHDTGQKTVTELAPFIIAWAQARNLKMVTVAECLGDSVNTYRQVTIPAGYVHACTDNAYTYTGP